MTLDNARSALLLLRSATDKLQDALDRPMGPAATPEDRKVAGHACVSLCGGNHDKARSLWKLLESDLGGYMPRAAAVVLIRAANTENLVPDVEAPEPK